MSFQPGKKGTLHTAKCEQVSDVTYGHASNYISYALNAWGSSRYERRLPDTALSSLWSFGLTTIQVAQIKILVTSRSISAMSSLEKDSRGFRVSINRPEGVLRRSAATATGGAGGGLLQCAGGRRELLCGCVLLDYVSFQMIFWWSGTR